MELKLPFALRRLFSSQSSNCTFMELKLPLHVKKLAVMVKFKLYLYGIEIFV